jgi:hypothetical protein
MTSSTEGTQGTAAGAKDAGAAARGTDPGNGGHAEKVDFTRLDRETLALLIVASAPRIADAILGTMTDTITCKPRPGYKENWYYNETRQYWISPCVRVDRD